MKLDKKFNGDLRKVKDGSEVPTDQWVVFLAKDDAFVLTLPFYRQMCERLGADPVQLAMVDELIIHVNQWRAAHPDLCKIPDAEGERRLP